MIGMFPAARDECKAEVVKSKRPRVASGALPSFRLWWVLEAVVYPEPGQMEIEVLLRVEAEGDRPH